MNDKKKKDNDNEKIASLKLKVKIPATKPDYLSSIPEVHMMEGDN